MTDKPVVPDGPECKERPSPYPISWYSLKKQETVTL